MRGIALLPHHRGTLPAATNVASPARPTPREDRVLGPVAEGRSNRQIGEDLFISSRTASVHVSNILARLGVRSRGEAAARAPRDGLV